MSRKRWNLIRLPKNKPSHRLEYLNNSHITRRCTGVAAGGFSVLQASTGRNPVNAVVRHHYFYKLHDMSGRTRSHLSGTHLFSAYSFANIASAIEAGDRNDAQAQLRCSYVIGAVSASVCFIEASINELYAICSDDPHDCHVAGHPGDSRFNSIGNSTIESLASIWAIRDFERYAKILEKYQVALKLARRPLFDEGTNPFQNAKLLIQLRNILVHFKPEYRDVGVGTGAKASDDEIARKYKGRFPENPWIGKFWVFGDEHGSEPAD